MTSSMQNCKSYDVTITKFFPQRLVGLTDTLLQLNIVSKYYYRGIYHSGDVNEDLSGEITSESKASKWACAHKLSMYKHKYR